MIFIHNALPQLQHLTFVKQSIYSMKKIFLVVVLFPLLTFAQSKKQRKAQEKADKITFANVQAHIQYLADDKLEGRRTGTKGEMLAMQYIADQFSKNGLQPKGTNGFIQEFTINEGKQFDEKGNAF